MAALRLFLDAHSLLPLFAACATRPPDLLSVQPYRTADMRAALANTVASPQRKAGVE
jgi:hypothetical protein